MSTLSDLSLRAAQRFGTQTALVMDDVQLSFQDIEERVARFAGGLRERGVQRGDPVVLHLPNGWRWIVAYYAIARLGAVVVPANFLLSLEEVAYIAGDSAALALIAPDERCRALREQHAIAGLLVSVATGAASIGEPFERLLDAAPVEPVSVAADDLFTIGYTSGTTGNPKGAQLSHRCVYMSTALTATIHVRQRGERVVSVLPFPHVYGNVVMNACFLVGMTLISHERFDAGWALESIQRHRATLFEGVPTMYYYMLVHPRLDDFDLSSLLRCTVGGQTMPTAKIDAIVAALGCPLLELWGMTEVAGPAISHSPHLPPRHGSIGQPLPGVEARICAYDDPERELPVDEAGELQVRGPLVMLGYLGREQANAETLLPGGWLRTGDIARRDADGYLFIVDRLKDMIITAGYKIFPAELEQTLGAHPAVAMVAVAPQADEVKGELAKAFIVLRPGHEDTREEEIIAFCRERLAAYKVPRAVAFVDNLPKTSTGKLLRRALRG
ncbi:class I adenylate-forming enzyme family protein [Pseudomonas sp. LRF_L74]|uniref:class I adenylate-forming enzyme family protein n=1 Tax=Pseudomonas sp. LRF_L74 TaxID=3369422 RepID=UPI003F619CCA